MQRLRKYTFDTGIPPGTTEDEGLSILDCGFWILNLGNRKMGSGDYIRMKDEG